MEGEGEVVEGEGEVVEGEGEVVEGERTATLTCTLQDSVTGEVIVNATVYTIPSTVVATDDGSGVYRLPDVPPGPYAVIADAPGYPVDRKAVLLDGGDSISISFRLVPLMESDGEGQPEPEEGEREEGEGELDNASGCRGCRCTGTDPEKAKHWFGDWLLIGLSMLILGSIAKW